VQTVTANDLQVGKRHIIVEFQQFLARALAISFGRKINPLVNTPPYNPPLGGALCLCLTR